MNLNEGAKNAKRLAEIVNLLRRHNIIAGVTPEKLPLLLTDLGPTFVKLGQIISVQPGALPADYCRELAKLRANVAPMSFEEVTAVLEEEYGCGLTEVFAEFAPEPLGAASIAQVHAAKLLDGDDVAVKVQRTGVYNTMSRDIMLLRQAAKILRYAPAIGHQIDFVMVIDEIWAAAKQETDFSIEAANAREFCANHEELEYVTCPKILDSYTTPRVLVMEYIDGIPIDRRQDLCDHGYDLVEIGEKLAHNYIKQVVEDGFFHADPHTGNIIIRGGEIVWIDMGMMGRLSARDKKLLASAVTAAATGDILKLKDVVLAIGVYKQRINHAQLSGDIETMLTKYGGLEFSEWDLKQIAEDFLAVLREHQISLPKGVSMLGRGMVTLQGTLRALSPEINIMEVLAAYASANFLRSIDLKKEAKGALKSGYFSLRKALDLPGQLSDMLKMMLQGTVRTNLDLSMSGDMHKKIDQMLNRVILAILTAALLVGSSLICTTDMQPKILGIPAVGYIGFFGAFILGSWLMFTIIRKH